MRRDDLLTFQVDGTHGSAVAGLTRLLDRSRARPRRSRCGIPTCRRPIDFFDGWQDVPDNRAYDNAFKVEWELFLRHVVDGRAVPWNLLEGAKGVQLAELGLQSWAERRWVDVPALRARDRACPRFAFRSADGTLARVHAARAPSAWPARRATPRWNRVAYRGRARRRRSAAPPSIRGSQPRSTGTRRSPTAAICGRSGFGVAEAMDTAQRGMGLDWPTSLELIRRIARARRAATAGAVVARGAGTDHLAPTPRRHARRRDRRVRGAVRGDREPRRPHHPDGEPRARARARARRTTTRGSTARVLAQVREPVILHWLGEMFDPALAGYWGDARPLDRGDGRLRSA